MSERRENIENDSTFSSVEQNSEKNVSSVSR